MSRAIEEKERSPSVGKRLSRLLATDGMTKGDRERALSASDTPPPNMPVSPRKNSVENRSPNGSGAEFLARSRGYSNQQSPSEEIEGRSKYPSATPPGPGPELTPPRTPPVTADSARKSSTDTRPASGSLTGFESPLDSTLAKVTEKVTREASREAAGPPTSAYAPGLPPPLPMPPLQQPHHTAKQWDGKGPAPEAAPRRGSHDFSAANAAAGRADAPLAELQPRARPAGLLRKLVVGSAVGLAGVLAAGARRARQRAPPPPPQYIETCLLPEMASKLHVPTVCLKTPNPEAPPSATPPKKFALSLRQPQ